MGNSDVEDNRRRSWAEEPKERVCTVGPRCSCMEDTCEGVLKVVPSLWIYRPCLNGWRMHLVVAAWEILRVKMPEIKERSYFAELPSVLQIEFQICRNLPREAATGEAGGSSVQLVSQGAAEAGTSSRCVHGLVAHQDFGSRHQTQVNGFWETHLWPHGLSLIASVGQELVRLPGRVSGPMCWRGCRLFSSSASHARHGSRGDVARFKSSKGKNSDLVLSLDNASGRSKTETTRRSGLTFPRECFWLISY
ncbi:uncharacterized protein LOC128915947 isoform X2 [Rissa tridactyla]|uniref:uncharacterized protein LOC128915947 isoform X2 n=1 Tax=Rissa tridactyla TaxID=75485 RepID=UPI0023BA466F|nr:uncharacterized protein LOC128915947 isoform X2 [Rissa tridactyla]